ncbi:PKD domain-containing protein [Gaoshiqia sp. Z1-71]|uniref:PKD domain-containing protein n=1 Tax=Gaoshiqia hydrogeniformans TaxID=3290090 RepID=UPI003BF7AA05
MKKRLHFTFFVLMTGIVLFQSCTEDNDRPTWPLSALIFHSVQDKQVAFTALTHSAVSWSWDFGDETTSTEKDPVHVYEEGGYYLVSLTAKDQDGNSVTKSVTVAVALTPYAMLTGDHTAQGYQGKTWKLTGDHPTGGDYFANANANFTTVSGTPRPLPAGIFSTEFGMGAIYDDTYTFYYDGKYVHDVKADGGAFSGFVYQFAAVAGGNAATMLGNLVKPTAAEIQSYLGLGMSLGDIIEEFYGLCIAKYTPQTGATFTFTENENFTVSSVYAPPTYSITFNNVMTLDFSGTEFIGFRDFQRKVIIKSISDSRMQLIMFMAAGADPAQIIGINTHALILSFEAVR